MEGNAVRWNGQRGHYEVYYVKVVDPKSERGLWFRYTMVGPTENAALEPRAELWAASFAPNEARATKETFPIARWAATDHPFTVRVADGELRTDGARGAAGDISWDLRWEPNDSVHRPYPYGWMLRTAWPRTKMLVPNLDLRVSGSVKVGRDSIELDTAPGEQAHLWGSRHAHEWVWAHCNAFLEEPGAVFEGLSAFPDPNRGPLTLLHLRQDDGREWTFNGPFVMKRTRSNFATERWAFAAEAHGQRLKGVVSTPTSRQIAVEYTDPDGSSRFCHHTELADVELVLTDRDGAETRLTSRGLGAFEYAARTHDARVRRFL